MTGTPTREGKIDFPVASIDTPCHTYFKVIGNLSSNQIPLVVLHGGPGSGHEYCLPFQKLWLLYGIPVIFYDQIGCASSTHLPHMAGDKSFWTMDLFIAELENLLEKLNINTYHLLGHSFGGMVSAVFASRQPPGLKRLILFAPPASIKLFVEGMQLLKKQLSPESQQAIDEAIKKRAFKSPAYLTAMDEFLRTFLCRADPWPPAPLAIDFKNQAEDTTVRSTLMGPSSPWVYDGVLGDWDSTPFLPKISVPTMVMNGEFDTTQHIPTAPFFENIPRVRWITIGNSSHMPFLDSEKTCALTMRFIGEFLDLKSRNIE